MNNYLRKYRERKYLMRIILSINLLIVSCLLVSLLAAYLYSQKISLDSQREANEKVLSQINYNISYMNETVKSFAISLFYDNDMAHLLFSSGVDRLEDTLRINKLNKTIAYNSFIHSIVIYNSKRASYFSVGDDTVTDKNGNLMNTIDGFLSGIKPIYKMQLMPVKYIPDPKHPDKTQEVFSLYMYDSLDVYNKSESALIINLKAEWLFEKLELMNHQSLSGSNRIFILDQNQEIYSAATQDDLDLDDVKNEVYRHIASTQNQVSQFTYTNNNEKQIVNYLINSSIDWVIVATEPYIAVVAAADQLKFAFITVAVVCFILALLASLFVSNKLYSPINGLLKQTKRLPSNDTESFAERDEIDYISHIYNHLIEKLMDEQNKQEGNESIIRSYYLRKLITDSSAFLANELQECIDKRYLRVNVEKNIILGVLKIDHYGKIADKSNGYDVKLLHYAISNIILEIVNEEMQGDVVDIRGEHLVLLFEARDGHTDLYEQISKLIRQAQKTVNNYYHITFTVSLSDLVPQYGKITHHYERTLDYLMYKMNFGINSVITPQMLRNNLENNETQIPLELERKLIEAIKSNRQEHVYQGLNSIHEVIAGMSSDAVIQSVIHLGIIIKQTIREINLNKLSPLLIDLRSIDRLVFEKETLDEIFAEFTRVLSAIFIDQKTVVENKDHVIVDTIKDVIQANYADANLGLQGISDMLKMSPAYVGRIFKKYETISVGDYINEIRLLKSVMLLEKNNLLVNEISERVGFSSQSYFFKLFRKRFGTTPKDYRIKKSLTL
jgi:AraC-like DNA-binding protein/GR25 family glycosyltransferase involved in LPS biosynthesis